MKHAKSDVERNRAVDEHPRTLGDAIRQGRNRLGLSQRALAVKMSELGVPLDASAVTRLENNQREPRLSEGIALSRFLQFDLFLFAPTGFSEAGLVANTVASYTRAADSIVSLVVDVAHTLGMQELFDREGEVSREQAAADLLQEIQDATEFEGELFIDGSSANIAVASVSPAEFKAAQTVLNHLLDRLGMVGGDDAPEA